MALSGGRPRDAAEETTRVKLTGPKVDGRRLNATIRRDPDTGVWVNPTMFGDETVRMLSDTPWDQGGAEEAKGLYAQVFADMLNAGDALPCPEHAKMALIGAYDAGYRWAGWDEYRPRSYKEIPDGCLMVRMASAVRSEHYFRDRLHLWDNPLADDRYSPIIYEYYMPPQFGSFEWNGVDGRTMERLAMLKDRNGRTMLDPPEHGTQVLWPGMEEFDVPVYLLGIADIDETVKVKSFDLIEHHVRTRHPHRQNWRTWNEWDTLIRAGKVIERDGGTIKHLIDSARTVVRHYPDMDNMIKGGLLEAIQRSGQPDSELLKCETLQTEINRYYSFHNVKPPPAGWL